MLGVPLAWQEVVNTYIYICFSLPFVNKNVWICHSRCFVFYSGFYTYRKMYRSVYVCYVTALVFVYLHVATVWLKLYHVNDKSVNFFNRKRLERDKGMEEGGGGWRYKIITHWILVGCSISKAGWGKQTSRDWSPFLTAPSDPFLCACSNLPRLCYQVLCYCVIHKCRSF
jgi:hypothetical protein